MVAEAVDVPGLLAWVIVGRALALVPAATRAVAGDEVVLHELADRSAPLTPTYVAAHHPAPDAAAGRVLELMTSPR